MLLMSTITSQTQSMQGLPAPRISSTQTFQSTWSAVKQSATAFKMSSQQVPHSVSKKQYLISTSNPRKAKLFDHSQ